MRHHQRVKATSKEVRKVYDPLVLVKKFMEDAKVPMETMQELTGINRPRLMAMFNKKVYPTIEELQKIHDSIGVIDERLGISKRAEEDRKKNPELVDFIESAMGDPTGETTVKQKALDQIVKMRLRQELGLHRR